MHVVEEQISILSVGTRTHFMHPVKRILSFRIREIPIYDRDTGKVAPEYFDRKRIMVGKRSFYTNLGANITVHVVYEAKS